MELDRGFQGLVLSGPYGSKCQLHEFAFIMTNKRSFMITWLGWFDGAAIGYQNHGYFAAILVLWYFGLTTIDEASSRQVRSFASC